MTIYEIDEQIASCFDELTGEIFDEDKLNQLMIDRDTKLENVALAIKCLRADAEAIKNEAKNLKDRAESKLNKADSMEKYLASVLGGEQFETTRCKISFRSSKSVGIVDETKVPKEWFTETTTSKLNKAEALKALKSGTKIEGLELQEKQNIQIK